MGSTSEMSPEASPGHVSKKFGVRRVNNVPVYLLWALVLAFALIMMLVAMDRAAKQNAPADSPDERVGNTAMFAKEIIGNLTSGIIAAENPPVPPDVTSDIEPIIIAKTDMATSDDIATPDSLDKPPNPPKTTNQPMRDDEANRIRMAKLQMLEEAVRAKTTVQTNAPRSSGSLIGGAPPSREEMRSQITNAQQHIDEARRDDPTAAYQARLAKMRGMGGASSGSGGAPQLLQTSGSNPNHLAQFQSGESDRWQLNSQLEAPRSPYELRAGFVVPAALISGINSDLPGQIMAQVSQSVYDTATGRHLLIPQGSRLVGSYSSDIAYGQSRVLVAWQRIVFPDGKAMDIGAMPGADSAGYSGFNDKINNHYFRLFSSAFLMSGVTAGITVSQDNSSITGDKRRASDAMSEALGQQLGQVTAQLIAKNMNIAPTIEIRPGYRFNVIVTKDMTFSKPYTAFDY